MVALRRDRQNSRTNVWPGFVDMLASLLLVFIFLLSAFTLTQIFLSQEISGKDTALERLESTILELSQQLDLEKGSTADLEQQLELARASLANAELAQQSLRTRLAESVANQVENNQKDQLIATLTSDLDGERDLSQKSLDQIRLLNLQISALRQQITALEKALEISEEKEQESRTKIDDLGQRLNVALAQRVEELSSYRSDFFGRLRDILGERSDVLVQGDRFVFQSEVLFAAGQAEVSDAGLDELEKLSDALLQLENEIPDEISWVLRIDGHTDKRPINTQRFPSNWELSAARAISVANFLVSKGVDPKRLVAAGFGEFQPLQEGDSEEIYRRNRRIEFKLTD